MAAAAAAAAVATAPAADEEGKVWEVAELEELRVEVPSGKGKRCTVELTRGQAEIFGSELVAGREYPFGEGAKFAVFSWQGCAVRVRGDCKLPYVAGETPMPQYVRTHQALERLRAKARESGADGRGPTAMVVGPTDSGKSTLCEILVNYSVRAGWRPTFVDLDVGQNAISVPGVVAAVPVDKPTLVTREFGLGLRAPVCFHYGHASPRESDSMYREAVGRLEGAVFDRFKRNEVARHGGVFINTCGWVDGDGYELVVHAAQTFRVDVMLVVGQERLWSQLKADERLADVYVDKVAKSGGVVLRDPTDRKAARLGRARDYFYGPAGNLRPHQKVVPFNKIQIFRPGGGPAAPLGALPLGAAPKLDPNRLVRVDPTPELNNCLLGVSYAKTEEELRTVNLAGFVHVVSVDAKRRLVTLLAPSPGPLPGAYLLASTVKYYD